MKLPVKKYGHVFESYIVLSLRNHHSCGVYTSQELDRYRAIDVEIRDVGKRILEKRVQVQMTLQARHYGKLRRFLTTRPTDPDIVSLYVEFEARPRAWETASHIVWAAKQVQTLPPYGEMPAFLLSITDRGVSLEDPFALLVELEKERNSSVRTAALMQGTAFAFDGMGFKIRGSDGKIYLGRYMDAFNGKFRRLLRNAGDRQIDLRFLPTGRRATDIRPRQKKP